MSFLLTLSVIPHAMPSYIELRTRKETFSFKLVLKISDLCVFSNTNCILPLFANQSIRFQNRENDRFVKGSKLDL